MQAAQKGTNCPFLKKRKQITPPPKSTTKQTLQGLIVVRFWKACPIPLLAQPHTQGSFFTKFPLEGHSISKVSRYLQTGGHEGMAHASLALVFHMELHSNDGDLPPESFPWNDGGTTWSKDVSLESC